MQSKYHHLIPRTYLTAWGNTSGTLKIEWIETRKYENRNVGNIAGINHYHSIIAGMPFCTKEDTDRFFGALNDYIITYDGKTLTDTLEMNKYYGVFNDWSIKCLNGTEVRKTPLKSEIDNIKIQDIEENWSAKYENKWNAVRNIIEQKILSGQSIVPRFYFGYLMKFFTALDWRSTVSNQDFMSVFNWICDDIFALNKVEIPKDERKLPMFETAAEYMKHCLLLSYYRQFLNDTGVIYKCAKEYMKRTSFHFLVSNSNEDFVTSDNPAFIATRKQGDKIGILPITPKILMIIGRNAQNDENYYVTRIDPKEVHKYNKMIKNNASQFVVCNNV